MSHTLAHPSRDGISASFEQACLFKAELTQAPDHPDKDTGRFFA